MEAIWNYFFWQALSTNALDDLGHVLRLNVSVNACSATSTTARSQEAVLDQCKQWLGPSQPGVTTPTRRAGLGARRPAAAPRRRPPSRPPRPGADAAVLDYLLGAMREPAAER